MIALGFITQEADEAARRYGDLLELWRTVFNRGLDQLAAKGVPGLLNIQAETAAIARSYLSVESVRIQMAGSTSAQNALGATMSELGYETPGTFTDDALEHLNDASGHLLNELALQVDRDVAFLLLNLRRVNLIAQISAKLQRTDPRATLAGQRIGEGGAIRFFYPDRDGKKWISTKYVRTIWRAHLLDTYNDVVAAVLAEHGVGTAEVVHQDPKHADNGRRLDLSGGGEGSYETDRTSIFHPNAGALLRKAA